MKQTDNLKLLEPNKTVTFKTPISDYNTCFVRTGVINDDGNSFLHAILTSYSKDYFYMDIKNKINFLEKIKNTIFTKNMFYKNNDNYLDFKDKLHSYLDVIYNFFTQCDNKINIDDKKLQKIIKNMKINEVSEFIFELISYDELKKLLFLENNYEKFDYLNYKNIVDKNLTEFLDSLEILSKIDKVKADYIKINILKIINDIIDNVDEIEYKNYYKNVLCNISNDTLNIICNYLKLNIYFIDSETRLPFTFENQNYKYKKNIILLKYEDVFENLGLLLPENKVQRDFIKDDYIIRKIKSSLLKNKKSELDHPNHESDSDSDSEHESEHGSEHESESEQLDVVECDKNANDQETEDEIIKNKNVF